MSHLVLSFPLLVLSLVPLFLSLSSSNSHYCLLESSFTPTHSSRGRERKRERERKNETESDGFFLFLKNALVHSIVSKYIPVSSPLHPGFRLHSEGKERERGGKAWYPYIDRP
jgi:hypothetical protein